MIVIIRTIILYATVVYALRFMGKKQIGQLEPSELATAIMISELASLPLAGTDIPLLNGIIPVIILSVCEIFISSVTFKKKKLRKIITGHPTIIIENGKIKEEALGALRYTIDDILVEMRLKGISDFNDIQYAILETNGQMSFILENNSKPPTIKDMKIQSENTLLSFPVVCGGVLNNEYLQIIQRDENWLISQINALKIPDIEKILILMANHNKVEYYQLKKG